MRLLLALALCVSAAAAPYASNALLQVRLDAHTGVLTVTDLRDHHAWTQKQVGSWIVTHSRVDKGEIQLTLHDAADNLGLTAQVTLSKDKPEMEVTLSGSGPLKTMVGFPFPFITGKGTGLVVPMNEGILYPVDDASINNRRLVAYGGHGICMPWFRERRRHAAIAALLCVNATADLRYAYIQDSLRVY